MPAIVIRLIPAADTRPLRQTVLRPGSPLEANLYPNDTLPTTAHFGAYAGTELVGVATVYPDPAPTDGTAGDWRLRGMATAAHVRRQGIGGQLLSACVHHVALAGGTRFWCNGRVTALDFYRAYGFTPHGAVFETESGPHFVLTRLITPQDRADALATTVAARFAALPQVVAVTLAGSQTSQMADTLSDLDFYVYAEAEIPPATRAEIARSFATSIEIDNQFWEPGDEWVAHGTGLKADIMYRSISWIETQLERLLVRHEASVGYSTCFWDNVLKSRIIYDRNGWFGRLQAWATQPYPASLRDAILAKNYPLLRQTLSSYQHQIESALARQDRVSLNHRVAALLASYFDILFAINGVPHPGEKRLIALASSLPKQPDSMAEDVEALLCTTAAPWGDTSLLPHLERLIDRLDALLQVEGLLPAS